MTDADICPLCDRPLGARREEHHLVPRSYGGRATVALHPICHRKIHATFDDRDLAREYHALASLRAHPEIVRFRRWVAGKPPDFHKRTEPAKRRHRA